jgi:single-strand DNA-binding protein
MNLATATIIGKLTHDPEMKNVELGDKSKPFVSFQLAVNSFRKNQPASFFKVEAWDKQAEIINEYARKGSELLVMGELKQERWTNSNGESKEKVKLVVQSVQLGNKPKGNEDPAANLDSEELLDDVF